MKNNFFIIIALVVGSIGIFGFIKKPNESVKYDYVQLTQHTKTVGISSSVGYSERNGENDGILDNTLLMKAAQEYQNNGYEIVNSSCGGAGSWIVFTTLLKKPL